MASPYQLASLYSAAGQSQSQARAYGSMQAGAAAGGSAEIGQQIAAQRKRRLKQLSTLLNAGTLKASQLGPADSKLVNEAASTGGQILAPGEMPPAAPVTSLPGMAPKKSPFGFFKNLLGGGWNALYGFVPGVYNVGKAATQDLLAFNTPANKSHLYKEIVKPLVQNYKNVYGPGGGSFWENFYANPLGPVLDVAALASGGASAGARIGGAVARGAEAGSTAQKLGSFAAKATSREGRLPVTEPTTGRVVQREFTPRPIPRAFQVLTDPLIAKSRVAARIRHPIAGDPGRVKAIRDAIDIESEKHGGITYAAREELKNLTAFYDLSPDEASALTYLQIGVNTPHRLAAMEHLIHGESLQDNITRMELENEGFNADFVQHHTEVPESVQNLMFNPNEKMIEAHRQWVTYVEKERINAGISAEKAAEHVNGFREMLDRHAFMARQKPHISAAEIAKAKAEGREPRARHKQMPKSITPQSLDPRNMPIKPTYTPIMSPKGFVPFSPGRISKLIPNIHLPFLGKIHDRLGIDDEQRFRRGGRDRPRRVTEAGNLLNPQDQPLFYDSLRENFRQGLFRDDARMYLDHANRRVAAVEDALHRGKIRERFAKKDENGEFIYVKDDREAKRVAGPDAVAVPDLFIKKLLRQENKMTGKLLDQLHAHIKQYETGADPFAEWKFDDFLHNEVEKDANALVNSTTKPELTKHLVMDKHVLNYIKKLADVPNPYDSAIGRIAAKFMHYWRTGILTLMPRWWINTAVGSFLMNAIRGVPVSDYIIANRLRKQGHLPIGAELTHQIHQELTESAAQAYVDWMGVRMPTRKLYDMVQQIENFFRRAAWVTNLRREIRLHRDQSGRMVDLGDDGKAMALEDMGGVIKDHFDMAQEAGGNMESLLNAINNHPELIRRATDETNRMAYSYTLLGPSERRYVRTFIPFWGWYKFISQVAWRLPFEYPGRARMLGLVSQIALDQKNEMGPHPDWLNNTIALGLTGEGKYKYLSTLGLNPFGQFLNPLGPEGPVAGALQVGQFNPVIQAALQAYGYDPLTGDPVMISPQSGVSQDQFGQLTDPRTGAHPSARQVAPLRRGIMAIMRSIPEFRLAEQFGYNRGRPIYPESVPFIAPRFRSGATNPNILVGGLPGLAAGMLGISPRQFDLRKYQYYARQSQAAALHRYYRELYRIRTGK